MTNTPRRTSAQRFTGFLQRLAKGKGGNTIMLVAAGLVPMVAMIGGGVDISRGYMAQSRLQQACDAGALAARKEMSGSVYTTNTELIGQRFFESNFPDGLYGAEDPELELTHTTDNNVEGVATVTLPLAMMGMFGAGDMELEATCKAELSISNVDIMFVLDVTGSMADPIPGDTVTRIAGLKSAVFGFYDTLQDAVSTDSRVRYGFVPYSQTVNMGGVVPAQYILGGTSGETWEYDSRTRILGTAGTEYNAFPGYAVRQSACNDVERTVDNANGTTTSTHTRTVYWSGNGNNRYYICYATDIISGPGIAQNTYSHWAFKPLTLDAAAWYASRTGSQYLFPGQTPGGTSKSRWNGCIEEADTVVTGTYSPIPSGANDMVIDLKPNTRSTKWRPQFRESTYNRQQTDKRYLINEDQLGNYGRPSNICPQVAAKLATYPGTSASRSSAFETYVNGLSPNGNTYHDIGMIWGARFISPDGIFGSENTSAPNGEPIARHIIFMTDGEIAPNRDAYSAWGVERSAGRIGGTTAQQGSVNYDTRHEARFEAICNAASAKNISIWVVAFGTGLTTALRNCADSGRAFVASDADELASAFTNIASKIAELRITE